jgi:hypothetical protein
MNLKRISILLLGVIGAAPLALAGPSFNSSTLTMTNISQNGVNQVEGIEVSVETRGKIANPLAESSRMITIQSNIPMTGVVVNAPVALYYDERYCRYPGMKEASDRGELMFTFSCGEPYSKVDETGSSSLSISFKQPVQKVTLHRVHGISEIKFGFSGALSVTPGLVASNLVLRKAYEASLFALDRFASKVAKSHRGHLTRFRSSLVTGIDMLKPDAKEVLSVVHWKVQENARMVVVFGTILNELLTDYDDVEELKTSVLNLVTLTRDLRQAYGWETGLAGTVSKATVGLLEVFRLELQELASIRLAMGDSIDQYRTLLTIARDLIAEVSASDSGDIRAALNVSQLRTTWNASAWQDELKRLMNAGPDFRRLVLPKMQMLLRSVESINDFVGIRGKPESQLNIENLSDTPKSESIPTAVSAQAPEAQGSSAQTTSK